MELITNMIPHCIEGYLYKDNVLWTTRKSSCKCDPKIKKFSKKSRFVGRQQGKVKLL